MAGTRANSWSGMKRRRKNSRLTRYETVREKERGNDFTVKQWSVTARVITRDEKKNDREKEGVISRRKRNCESVC